MLIVLTQRVRLTMLEMKQNAKQVATACGACKTRINGETHIIQKPILTNQNGKSSNEEANLSIAKLAQGVAKELGPQEKHDQLHPCHQAIF